MSDLFLLEVHKRGLGGQVSCNGVPLRSWTDGAVFETTDPINVWLRPDRNRIDIELRKPQTTSGDSVRHDFHLLLKQMVQSPGKQTSTRTLLTYDLPAEHVFDKPSETQSTQLPISISKPPASRLWSALAPIQLTAANRRQALQVVERLHNALDRKDMASVTRILRTKATDVALCYGIPVQQALPRQEKFFLSLMQVQGWAMTPYHPLDLNLRVVADGQLLWVTGENEAPALRSQPNSSGTSLELPLYLAQIQGSWVVAR